MMNQPFKMNEEIFVFKIQSLQWAGGYGMSQYINFEYFDNQYIVVPLVKSFSDILTHDEDARMTKERSDELQLKWHPDWRFYKEEHSNGVDYIDGMCKIYYFTVQFIENKEPIRVFFSNLQKAEEVHERFKDAVVQYQIFRSKHE